MSTITQNKQRIFSVPNEGSPPTFLNFKSSDKDYQESLKLIQDPEPSITELPDEEQQEFKDQEVDSNLIRQKMAAFRNQPLPENARPMSVAEFNKYKEFKDKLQQHQKQVSPINKEKVLAILGIGRKRDFVEVDGNKFHLRTLKDGEQSELNSIFLDIITLKQCKNDADFAQEQQRLYLSFAIEKIVLSNSTETTLTELALEAFGKDSLEARLSLLKEMDYHFVITPLFKKFIELKTATNIKSSEEAKEVVDDIKK